MKFSDWATQAGIVHRDDVETIEQEVEAEVTASVTFAEAGSWEPVEDLCRDVTTPGTSA